jgi:hypothetical protein
MGFLFPESSGGPEKPDVVVIWITYTTLGEGWSSDPSQQLAGSLRSTDHLCGSNPLNCAGEEFYSLPPLLPEPYRTMVIVA